MNSISKEYALLSSYMFCYSNISDMEKLPKLNTEIFTNGFTKSIAMIINTLIQKHAYCDDLAVEAFITKNQSYNEKMWIDLISQTPLIPEAIQFYTKWLTHEYAQRRLNGFN